MCVCIAKTSLELCACVCEIDEAWSSSWAGTQSILSDSAGIDDGNVFEIKNSEKTAASHTHVQYAQCEVFQI